MSEPTFDYIIIGVGTAGCLLANRLIADPSHRVLLIEAGGRDNYPWIHIPVGYLYCIDNPRTDWRFRTAPSAGLNGRELLYPRGKTLAMDMILTGRTINASEAKAAGLVARVVPSADLLQTALEAAHTIAGYNAPAVRMAKEAVNRAQEVGLTEGMLHERRLFQAAFATDGQKEGMQAFLAKRAPVFRHR